jgi:hypothetical protein
MRIPLENDHACECSVCSCLPTVARAELDNAMQHAFGILSLARLNPPQAVEPTEAEIEAWIRTLDSEQHHNL